MKSINFKQCLKVIRLNKQLKGKTDLHIGLFDGIVPPNLKHFGSDPFLFSPSHYGEGTVTMEKPMSNADLKRQKLNGSLLMTYCTVVGVPASLVVEVIV